MASGRAGRRRFGLLASALLGVLLAGTPSTGSGRADPRIALVVGNGRYVATSRLANPPNDARAIAQVLRGVGFEVTEVIDAGRARLEEEIRRFRDARRGVAASIFFYAGHGLQIDGENYLVPVDARFEDGIDVVAGLIGLSGVVAPTANGSRVNLVFLDACRDNPLGDSLKQTIGQRGRSVTLDGGRPVRSVGQGLAEMKAGVGTLIAYATAPDTVAEDGHGKHSPFSLGLLRYIREPGLEIRQLLTKVRLDVVKETERRQVPWDHSSLTENFYFIAPVKPKRPALPPP